MAASSSRAYDWENEANCMAGGGSDIEEEPCSWEGDDLFDDFEYSKARSAELFAEYLLELRHKNVLSNKQVCVLAWWATHAGIDSERVSRLSFRPDAPPGHLPGGCGLCSTRRGMTNGAIA